MYQKRNDQRRRKQQNGLLRVVVVVANNNDQKASRLFSGERVVVARFVTNMNWRKIRLHFSNSILYPKTKRERACSLRARTRKRGEPRDAAKRRRQQHHQHRFRRRERKRSETSSCVIISIHNIHVFFATVFPIEYSSVESMRTRTTTRPRVSENRKTFFADPFFSFLSLSSSFFTTCKQQQQQPISTRRRERQIGRRCGDRKMGRKRSRNSIAVERVSQ